MSDATFQDATESRLRMIEQNQARTSTYFKLLGCVLAIVSLPVFMVALDMRSAVNLLTVQSKVQTSALNKLSEKMEEIFVHGSPRTVDKIKVNTDKIQQNSNVIKDIDLRLRTVERECKSLSHDD